MPTNNPSPGRSHRVDPIVRPRSVRVALATAAIAVLAACTPSGPGGGGNGAGQGVCRILQDAPAGADIVLPNGTHALDGNAAVAGDQACVITPIDRAGVTVRGTAPGAVLLLGALQCIGCTGWTFDNVNVAGTGTDARAVVGMTGGAGWSWTDCTVFQYVGDFSDADGRPRTIAEPAGTYGLFTVGVGWAVEGVDTGPTGFPVDWNVARCTIWGNGNHPGHDDNQDHAIYVAAVTPWGWSTNGVIDQSYIGYTTAGSPVKIGFGNSDGSNGGSVGVTVRRSTILRSHSSDGVCGVLLAGASNATTIEANDITCPPLVSSPAEIGYLYAATQPFQSTIGLGTWPTDGTGTSIRNNHFHRTTNPAGSASCSLVDSLPPGAGTAIAGTVRSVLTGTKWAALPLDACTINGIAITGNTAD